jgi:hypothetical protein
MVGAFGLVSILRDTPLIGQPGSGVKSPGCI